MAYIIPHNPLLHNYLCTTSIKYERVGDSALYLLFFIDFRPQCA